MLLRARNFRVRVAALSTLAVGVLALPVAATPAMAAASPHSFDVARDGWAVSNGDVPFVLRPADLAGLLGPASCTVGGLTCSPSDGAPGWIAAVRSALGEGQCFGMAIEAARRFNEGAVPTSLAPARVERSGLSLSGSQVRAISRASALQFLLNDEQWRAMQATPKQVVAALQSLETSANLEQVLVIATSSGRAHAVLPVAIDALDDAVTITVYDPNDPRRTHDLRVSDLTWQYAIPGGPQAGVIGDTSAHLFLVRLDSLPA